jgi:hypothetical protein
VNGSRVTLPPEVDPPFEVYVNGLIQIEGGDYAVEGRELAFARELAPPVPDTARSLVRGFFFGRYRPEHVVDVAYQAGGRGHVVSGLPIRPPGEPTSSDDVGALPEPRLEDREERDQADGDDVPPA